MEYNCLNCNQQITENFCTSCGQKKYKRIDRKYIWDEIQYSLIHTNKGFLYSVKNIIQNPGKTAREFIDGNRVNHYKPLLLAFVLSGISAFISFKIVGLSEIMKQYYSSQNLNSTFMNDSMSLIASYNSIFMLLLLPVFAFFTKLAFMKWGQNYYEHIVMNSYILSFYTLSTTILIYPLLYFFKDDMNTFVLISGLSMLTIPFILIWFFKGFYQNKSLKNIILRVLSLLGLMILGYLLLIIVVIIGASLYNYIKGPEATQYLKQQ